VSRILIVANRLPVKVRMREDWPRLVPSDGGLATAVRSVHQKSDSLWIGWRDDALRLTTAQSHRLESLFTRQRILPVSLSPDEAREYYEGFSNAVLWPLFHYQLDRVPLDTRTWPTYRTVNERFAEAAAGAYQPGDLLWVHDYQLMLVPQLLRERLPDARIGFFLHIPFPSYEIFRTLPWRRELLQGVLGADLIGMHTFSYVRYFSHAVHHILGLEPNGDRVQVGIRDVRIAAFPLGIDTRHFEDLAAHSKVEEELSSIRAGAQGRRIIVGVDRLDYTKGILRRLLAFERVLERNPDLANTLRLVQVAVPSRTGVGSYKKFRRELNELVGRINGRFGGTDSLPIHYLYRSIPIHQLVALYRAADVMLVTALRDGMNLVAKEFVASRIDDDGVLVLSEFAGASEELGEAVRINPYDVDAVADAIVRALRMPVDERRARMRTLRRRVRARTSANWADAVVTALRRQQPTRVPERAEPPQELRERLLEIANPVLLLDYDGTLVPFATVPDLAKPDPTLLELLHTVAAGVEMHIVSGRRRDDLDEWFGGIGATLWAEHGAWRRGVSGWQAMGVPADTWRDGVRSLFDEFAACTPGALVEEKSVSIAWHYRAADPVFGERQARQLRLLLNDALQNQPAAVLQGSKVIEVRPSGVHKGRVVEHILRTISDPARIIAIGDDRTDEEMFAAVPPEGTTIHVGPGPSRASHRLADSAAVRDLLRRIRELIPANG
jgi:trehalose 6-phosphate synthase/phosphatase